MKLKLFDTIIIGSLLFGGIWSVFVLYLINLVMPEGKKRKAKFQQNAEAYAGVLRKLEGYRRDFEKLAANSYRIDPDRIESVILLFDEWEAHVYQLVNRLREFEAINLIQHEQSVLPRKIRNGRIRLSREKDPRLRLEIQETLDSYLRQQAQLDNLQFLMEKTQLDLEEFVAGIGAIYSQLHTLDAMDVRSRRVHRLAHELEEEKLELDDLLTTLNDVYYQSTRL